MTKQYDKDEPTYLLEGIIKVITTKAIKVDDRWYPLSVFKYGRDLDWSVGLKIEAEIYEWFMVNNGLI